MNFPPIYLIESAGYEVSNLPNSYPSSSFLHLSRSNEIQSKFEGALLRFARVDARGTPPPPWNPSNLYANQPINQRRTSRVSLAKWQLPIGACADHERATTGLKLFSPAKRGFGLNRNGASMINEPLPWDGE